MIAYAILFLFFFRLLTDFIGAIYAFGLLGTSFPPEIVSILLLFTPVLLLFSRREPSKRTLFLTGLLTLIAGAVEGMLDTRGRMLLSGSGVGSFLLFLPSLLSLLAAKRKPSDASSLGTGLALGLALFILARAWNSGVDPFDQGIGIWSAWALAIIAGFLLPGEIKRANSGAGEPVPESHHPPFSRIVGLSLGVLSALGMLYFAFESSNVLANWTGANYEGTLASTVLSLSLFAILFSLLSRRQSSLPSWVIILWNALFVISLVAAILPHQLKFPTSPGNFPFYEPPVAPASYIPFYAMIVLFPVILLDFTIYCQELVNLQPGIRRLGGGFSLAALFLLLVIFAQVFTTVYDYVPIIGSLFRGRFWLVFLVLGLGLALPALLVRQNWPARGYLIQPAFAGIVTLIGVASLTGPINASVNPPAPPQGTTTLRIMTYNIQQGYSASGQKSLAEQLDLMAQVNADLIGLQETDSNRIAGGNSDLARYFADRLNRYVYNGPKVVPGTFGIALLSRYPIQNPKTFYLYSQGEQTAAIGAEITAAGTNYHVFVTHLGNGGPIVQQEALLREITRVLDEGGSPVIAMGDFNFKPGTEQYQKTTVVLKDSWLLKWPSGIDDQGNNPAGRIDHIFLSPGLEVIEARYLSGPQSDHPAYSIDISP